MGPIEMFKLFCGWQKLEAVAKEKEPMNVKVPQLLTLITSLAATLGLPTLLSGWVHAHPSVYLAIVGVAVLLHALMPSVFGAPSAADTKAVGLSKAGLFLLPAITLGLLAMPLRAQTSTRALTPAPTPTATAAPVVNLYGAGVSYSVNGSPAVAGTGLYAHLLNNSGTYAFTAVDAVPTTIKPLTMTTNIGAGIAQKVFTLGSVPIYMPTAAGISWSGTNTGWQWNGGAIAAIKVKDGYYVMPSIRFLKSSVSNGSGYQPIFGVLFGWGK